MKNVTRMLWVAVMLVMSIVSCSAKDTPKTEERLDSLNKTVTGLENKVKDLEDKVKDLKKKNTKDLSDSLDSFKTRVEKLEKKVEEIDPDSTKWWLYLLTFFFICLIVLEGIRLYLHSDKKCNKQKDLDNKLKKLDEYINRLKDLDDNKLKDLDNKQNVNIQSDEKKSLSFSTVYACVNQSGIFTNIAPQKAEDSLFEITQTSETEGEFTILNLDSFKANSFECEKFVEYEGCSINDNVSKYKVLKKGRCKKTKDGKWKMTECLQIKISK